MTVIMPIFWKFQIFQIFENFQKSDYHISYCNSTSFGPIFLKISFTDSVRRNLSNDYNHDHLLKISILGPPRGPFFDIFRTLAWLYSFERSQRDNSENFSFRKIELKFVEIQCFQIFNFFEFLKIFENL